MILLVTIIKVTLLVTWNGILSEDIERLSSASINKAIGENATIVWNIKEITAAFYNPLVVFISKGEIGVRGVNIVFQFTVYTADSSPNAAVGAQSAYKQLASRSTAIYTYTGKSSAGQETARVSFIINNLILDDEGSYILTARVPSSPTNISVNYGPERCGNDLKSEYIVNKEHHLMITSGFCGKPQPTVTCTINGAPLKTVVITEVSQYNYTYTVDTPKLEPCDRRQLSCTVKGYGKSFTNSAVVQGQFTSNVGRFIKNIKFVRDCGNCSTVSWEKKDSTGNCDVHHQLQFFNATNITTTSVYLKGNSYHNCSLQSDSARVVTSIYGSLSGTYKLVDKPTSDTVQVNITPCTATTKTTTTTAVTDVDHLRLNLNEKTEEVHLKTIIVIVLGVIIVLFIILMLLFIALVKIGRIKIEFIQKSKPKKIDEEYQENIPNVNTVVKPPSDYMELQAARKDTTYQALTSVQSTPDAAKDNSAYEVCYKKH